MDNSSYQKTIFPDTGGKRHRSLKILLYLLLIPGVIVFLVGALKNGELRIWQVYLVNLLFWSGLSQAGITVSALLHTTNGKWGRDIQHIMEGLALFSPVSLILFLVLFIGEDIVFPWVIDPVPEKDFWLNITHLFVRQNFNFVVMNILNLTFLYHSFRPDIGLLKENGVLESTWFVQAVTSGWRGYEQEKKRSENALRYLSPVILFVYVVVYSMVAFDLVKSLDLHWYSTLFVAYYFITNLYLGIAGITVVVIVLFYAYNLEGYITESHLGDLGVMIFVFCLIALDFFWSQYLVIWYGNIPEEISFVVDRIKEEHWLPYSLVILMTCFVLPFVILLSNTVKKKPHLLLPVACLVLVGMWLERYLLVVPTLWHGDDPPLGYPEFMVTLTFLSGFILLYLAFMERFPVLPQDAKRA
jgi:hypothetical protein